MDINEIIKQDELLKVIIDQAQSSTMFWNRFSSAPASLHQLIIKSLQQFKNVDAAIR